MELAVSCFPIPICPGALAIATKCPSLGHLGALIELFQCCQHALWRHWQVSQTLALYRDIKWEKDSVRPPGVRFQTR